MPHDHLPPPSASANPVLVELLRGGLVESRHRGAAAIVDPVGQVRESWGDIAAPVYPRSTVKPLQALPLVETGAAEAFELGAEELALACASHRGLPMHVDRVAAWLARIGRAESDLVGDPGRPLADNCSGKHVGFLTLARHLGAPAAGYGHPAHPVQQRVLGTLEQMTGLGPGGDPLPCGVDGCSVPTWAVPLSRLALVWARFAVPDDLPPARAGAARTLAAAMAAHPDLVDGPGTFNSRVLAAGGGRVLVKRGAEGVYAAGLPEYGLGVAVKIDDGADRAAEVVMAALLRRIGVLDDLEMAFPAELAQYSRAGLPTGVLRPGPGLAT